MRRLRALFGFVVVSAGLAGVWLAVSQTAPAGAVVQQHVMDRRSRGGSHGANLLALYGSPYLAAQSATQPLASNATRFCVAISLVGQSGQWADGATAGMVQLGTTFGAANSLALYRLASQNSCFWIAKLFDSGAVMHECDSAPGATDLTGRCVYANHMASYCQDGTTGYWFVDGVQTNTCTMSTSISLPATMRVGDLGSGSFTYGNGISRVCIPRESGATTGTVTADVLNGCGQFTATTTFLPEYLGCFGCLNVPPVPSAVTVYTAGDSITSGMGALLARSYPAKLQTLLGTGYNVTNGGVAGYTVSQIKAAYEATARNWGRCVFLGGINDIIRDGATGAATYTTASALLDEMRADGCRPIVVKPTPAKNSTLGWTTGRETEYETYRSNLATYCTNNAATTTCVETWGAGPSSGLGDGTSPPQLYSTYDSSDHTHPSQAGSDELAQLVYAGATWP